MACRASRCDRGDGGGCTGAHLSRRAAGAHIDLAAPGVGLLAATSIRGARGKSGTSYAVPFVTAAAALILSREPELGAAAVAERLTGDARDLGAEGADEVFGAGLLDVTGLCDRPVMAKEG